MKSYMVVGDDCGEYEGFNHWNVVGFKDKERAEFYCALLSQELDRLSDGRLRPINFPMDRNYPEDGGYRNTDYYVEEVDFDYAE